MLKVADATVSRPAAVAVRELRKSYGAVDAVRGISFTVAPGQTVGLLGGNGAGKTTTISMLLGVLTPSAGSIEILGLPLATKRYDILPRINFTSPYVDLPKRLSVTENLRVFAGLYGVRDGRKRIAELLSELDLTEVSDRPYANLSAGQRTRVSLAKSLLNSPELLLLDEPTASLDPDVGDRMRTLLERYRKQSGCAMLLASHNMAEVERLCDDVSCLSGVKSSIRVHPPHCWQSMVGTPLTRCSLIFHGPSQNERHERRCLVAG